jgi:hypothetical protein
MPEYRYIIKIDGKYDRSLSFYGNEEHLKLFETKEKAQTYINGWNIKNAKIQRVSIYTYTK